MGDNQAGTGRAGSSGGAGDWGRLRRLALTNHGVFARLNLKIRTKTGAVVPLEFNKTQRRLSLLADRALREDGFVRFLVLKGRQPGVSTWIQSRFYWRTSQVAGLRAYILTHRDEATQNLFAIAKRYQEHCPPWFAPEVERSNRTELNFSGIDSSYRMATANSSDAGRSDTIQLFHGSEVAFWRRAGAVLSGAVQAIPLEFGTEAYLEGTANGRGNEFFRLWQLAERAARGEIDPQTGAPYLSFWRRVFLPWYWVDEYRRRVPAGFKETKDEREIVARFKLDREQLQFRREKISEFGGGEEGEARFRQEYPLHAGEAFLFSGRRVFGARRVEQMAMKARPPKEIGRVEQVGSHITFEPDPDGWLQVWERPLEGESYVTGADVAEGDERGAQHSANVLIRAPVARQVARLAPNCDAEVYGRRCVLASEWFNNAWLGIERNGLGITAVISARKTGYKYLYRMRSEEDATIGRKTGKQKIGWQTTENSRRVLVGDLITAVRDGSLLLRSEITVRQVDTFAWVDGRAQADEGELDDEVLSTGIAVQLIGRTQPVDEDDEGPGEGPGRGPGDELDEWDGA